MFCLNKPKKMYIRKHLFYVTLVLRSMYEEVVLSYNKILNSIYGLGYSGISYNI